MIPVGKRGRITNGDHAGWSVFVEDDEHGAYLILLSTDYYSLDAKGYDGWCEKQDLEQYFKESGWQVEWD